MTIKPVGAGLPISWLCSEDSGEPAPTIIWLFKRIGYDLSFIHTATESIELALNIGNIGRVIEKARG